MHQRFDVPEPVPREPCRLNLQRGGGFPIVPLQGPARGRGRKSVGGGELVLVESGDRRHLRQQLLRALVLRLLEIRIDQVIDRVKLIECAAAAVQPLRLRDGRLAPRPCSKRSSRPTVPAA